MMKDGHAFPGEPLCGALLAQFQHSHPLTQQALLQMLEPKNHLKIQVCNGVFGFDIRFQKQREAASEGQIHSVAQSFTRDFGRKAKSRG